MTMKKNLLLVLGLLILMLALPAILAAFGQTFYLGLLSRMLIYALAATSLNLILGYGGMDSFGHAVFLGLGGYGVAIAADHGITSALVAWPLALLAVAVFAVVMGMVSLRTRGVHFLMITLAMAEMAYYFFVSLRTYGGDDGLTMMRRSQFGWESWWPTQRDTGFYYLCLMFLVLGLWGSWRLVHSHFGRILVGLRENETRMHTIGFPVQRIKLVAFVIAAMMCGVAGMLNAELNKFISPSTMHWSQSGMLMVMVIIGGAGKPWAGVLGAVIFLMLEEVLAHFTERWQLPMGFLLLGLVVWRLRKKHLLAQSAAKPEAQASTAAAQGKPVLKSKGAVHG